jgi:cell division protein FtsQ
MRNKTKKPASPPDRLKARTLFFRRVKRSLRPGLWLLGGVLVIAAGARGLQAVPDIGPAVTPAGGVSHALAGIAAGTGFRVTKIEILGADTTPLPVIQSALGIAPGDAILGFSLRDSVARVEQLGPVQSATIQRAWPGTLIVTITERAPYAIWQTAGAGAKTKFVVIDKAGDVIANQDAAAARRRNPALLLLAGADAPQNAGALMAELAEDAPVMARVAAAERIDGLRWNLILKNQTVVKLPADDPQTALATLASLQTSMALLDRPVQSIDLRLPGKLIVHPYPTVAPPTAQESRG